jgi:Cu-Zn family superoxide dismutase
MRVRFTHGLLALVVFAPALVLAQAQATAKAELKDAKGVTVGNAELTEGAKGIVVRLRLQKAPGGEHAFHVHETGKCDPPTFQSAGGHLNPNKATHGIFSEKGPHAGDLPNVHPTTGGALDVEIFAPGLKMSDVLDADGAALVMHAKPDDYRSDPAGNAGDRIACGVITK